MNTKKILSTIEEILQKSADLKTSEILQKVLTLSKVLKDSKFEKWILLESSGYFNTNPAFTKGVKVPDYRRVPGQYHDRFNRPLIIADPDLAQTLNNYPVRESVAEMETHAEVNRFLSFRNPGVNSKVNELLNTEVETFTYSSNSLKSVVESIRSKIVDWLFLKQNEILSTTDESNINLDIPAEISRLHPIVQKVAGELYKNGHYRQAILDTYIALVDSVKVKSGKHELDNTPLMQSVFSIKNPIITISDFPDEQLGFMWLFSGAVMGIRNPKAHRLIEQTDPQRTFEWLCFASVLLRVLDDSKVN